jgi:hypothetical protein
MFSFFLDFFRGIGKKYPSFFGAGEENENDSDEKIENKDARFSDNDESFSSRWSWYLVFYNFCDNRLWDFGKVENLNYNQVLTHLTFIKQKTEMENAKNRFKKN